MTNHVNETPVQRIQRLLGEQVVVVWMARGTKGPKFRGWQKQTIEHMRDERYVANLNSGHNLGVLVGAPSGGVCSIDIDDDASVEPFLALNPQLRTTLFTRGKRGGNLWVKIRGQYPGSGKLETREGKAWGEWRSTGNQTVIHGIHPEGMEYRAVHDALAIELTFGEIVWPPDLVLPWKPRAERGKSVYSNVIQRVVGIDNVMQLRTRHLKDRFEIFRFLRKTLLIGVDVSEDFMSTPGASEAKGLVGGDWFNAEQKGGTGSFPIQGRFNMVITSNCRLRVRLQGDVGAWRRRMLLVRYEAPPPAKKIPDFADVLIREEGSGILNWALEGLALLLADVAEIGDVRLTERQQGIVDSLLAESDSLRVFLRERVERADGEALTTSEIVERYAEFCPERGWDPLPITAIHRQLESLMLELFQVCRSNSVQRDGKSQKGFRGVAFKPLP